ncbi:hypothetical protein niasHT_006732 [Heterodera trifolii]|uniref:C2H2-type domain-containing protein n=1 Tax=Heterodera trifolii TaxID=157864 RepID=A0ABD2LWL9_9BILA
MSSCPKNICKKFLCCLCGQHFDGVGPLESHLALVHVFYLAYECDLCQDALFPSDFALREHYVKIHNKTCFTVKYRVSPELDERRALLRRLVDQSMHKTDSGTIQQNKAPNLEPPNSYTSKLLMDCTSLLQTQLMKSNHFLNNGIKKENDWEERNDRERVDHLEGEIERHPIEGVTFYAHKRNALMGQKRTFFDEDNSTFNLNDRLSPMPMNSLNAEMDTEEMLNEPNLEIKVSPTKKQTKNRRKTHRDTGNDQMHANSSQGSNEETKQQKGGGRMVECSGCKRMVGQYRNSMLIHVSTHHCDQPIFECIADGCGKKWYSISARTKEHIEAKHGGDFNFLQDNRSSLLPLLRSTAVRLFSALFKRFSPKFLFKMENGTAKSAAELATNNGRGLRLVWVDCEMTGLPADNHRLVEIACIVTEADLTVGGHLDNLYKSM